MRSLLLTIFISCAILACVTSVPSYRSYLFSRRVAPPYHYRSSFKKRQAEALLTSHLAKELVKKHRKTKVKQLIDNLSSGSYKTVSKEEAARFMREHVSGPNAGFKMEVKTELPRYVPKHHLQRTNSRVYDYNAQLRAAISKAKVCKELQERLMKLKSRVKVIC